MKNHIKFLFLAFFKIILPAIITKVIPSVFRMALIAVAVAVAVQINPVQVFALLATVYIGGSILTLYFPVQGPLLLTTATDSLNLANLASEVQAYYVSFRQLIQRQLEIGLFTGPYSLADRYVFLPGIVGKQALPNVSVASFLHQFDPTNPGSFNPSSENITPGANILQPEKYEGDLLFFDNEMETTALAFLGKIEMWKMSDDPRAAMTFVEYLFMESIIPRAQADLRQTLIQGTLAPSGSGYNLLNIMNGVQTKLAAAVSASALTPVAMTSPTQNNIIPLVESVFDTLGPAYQKAEDLVCELSSTMYKLWLRANRLQNGTGRNFGQIANADLSIDGYPNCKIVQEPMLTGNKVLITQKSNKVIGFSGEGTDGTWEWQRFNRSWKLMMNGKIDFQFCSINIESGNNNVALGQ